MNLRARSYLLLAPPRWSDEALVHGIVSGGALVAAYVAKALSDLDPLSVDFSTLCISARAWMAKEPMYGQVVSSIRLVNYNPPHFHLLILPFALVPRWLGFLLWTGASFGAAYLTLSIAVRESDERWSGRHLRLLTAATLLAAGVGATIRLGQVSWWVALLVTLSWRAARRGNQTTSGVWAGVAIGLKPFLLLALPMLLVRRQATAAAVAATTAVASVLLGGLVFGWDALHDWANLLSIPPPVEQLRYFINASLAGVCARAGVPSVVALLLAGGVALSTIIATRTGSTDRAWLLVITGALLASPVGWVYYFPLVCGPLALLAVQGGLPVWTWWLWPALAFPPVARDLFQSTRPLAMTLGSMYTWGLLGLWIAGCLAQQSRGWARRYGKHAGRGAASPASTGKSPRTATNEDPVSTSMR